MPKKQSAGLLLYRLSSGKLEVLLVHPGGPFWKNKDDGSWTIPKGEFDENEDPLTAAKREFEEETGTPAPSGEYIPLQPIKQRAGKMVHAWAIEAEFDSASLRSNTFSIEWPPKSGKQQEFPEIDRAAWMEPEMARRKILQAQVGLVEEVVRVVG
ncbi:MAG: NUDIX domain-containing protein [Pyrinomonadaceae bacterium]